MLKTTFIPASLLAVALTACTGASSRDRAITDFNLNPAQVEIMDALVDGLKREGRGPLLGYRTFEAGAACYASNIRISERLHAVHIAYVSDYTAIEADRVRWFRQQGVTHADADDIYERAGAATQYCKDQKRGS